MATPAPSARVELLKPITGSAPMWAFARGGVSSGCYEGLPWFAGAAVMAATVPDRRVLLVALFCSIAPTAS